MNEPIGRFGSLSPARERPDRVRRRRSTASSWPITGRAAASICISFSISPSSIRDTGMPVQLATTSAMSSAPTSSFSSGGRLAAPPAAPCAVSSLSSRAGPRRRARRRAADPGRAARRSASARASSISALRLRTRSIACFSVCHCAQAVGAARADWPARGRSRHAARPRRLLVLLLERRPLDLELDDAPLDLVDLDRHGVDLDLQPRRRLVDQVDRLVGQEAVGDVAVGQHRRRDDRVVSDAHAVVHLVALLQAT